MANRSLGTPQNSTGDGLDPLAHRQILAALYGNSGAIDGLDVTANNDLTYHVTAGVGVTIRSKADGARLYYYGGGNTPAVGAGDASSPRIDSVWVKAQDPTLDSDNVDVIVGVTSGTPAATPQAPTLPAGCTLLRSFRVNAGVTSLSSGSQPLGNKDWLVPYGASLGLLAENTIKKDEAAYPPYRDTPERKSLTQFYVPTDRLVEVTYACTFTRRDAKWAAYSVNNFVLDNNKVPNSGTEWVCDHGVWETHETSVLLNVSKGYHTVAVDTSLTLCPEGYDAMRKRQIEIYFRWTDWKNVTYKGRTLRVWDRGVSK